jgi:hypothetical protein
MQGALDVPHWPLFVGPERHMPLLLGMSFLSSDNEFGEYGHGK